MSNTETSGWQGRKLTKKRRKTKGQEERLKEVNDSIRRKNLCIIGVPENAERARGPESIFEQIIAENFPNLEREKGIQIQEIEVPPQNQ